MPLTYHEKLVLKMLMMEKQHAEVPIFQKLVRNAERAEEESPDEREKRYRKLTTRPQTDEDNAGRPIRITPYPGLKTMLTFPSLMVNFPKITQPYILTPSDILIYDAYHYWQMIHEQKPNILIQMASEEHAAHVFYPIVANEKKTIGNYHVLCETVTETDLYIRRDYKLSHHRYYEGIMNQGASRQRNDEGTDSHRLIHIQYLHWSHPDDLMNPPDVKKLFEFYEYLNDNQLLVTTNERPTDPFPNRTATTSCPILMGSASIFAIFDAVNRMLNVEHKNYQPCIEKYLSKFFIKGFQGLQSPNEILLIYKVLFLILEKDDRDLENQREWVRKYFDSWKNHKTINYKRFLTSGDWCPWEFWVRRQIRRMRESEEVGDGAIYQYQPLVFSI
ncbi:hypothetical protein CAEBREN_19290 [Caenorhabditis brenneri]|uniref:Tyrosine-protein phosphatase domain-containing protein n=1 Tax=Caenorhabditis brenneri TaxID=135651 RepID=G0PJW3_CAEBE|nr:hypothetical protein CAEBREN_19290 [Caenorhabditis brenneri]